MHRNEIMAHARWTKPTKAKKFARKLRDLQRITTARERQIAKKTVEERAAYKEWQRTHKPGDPAKRAAERAYRASAADARKRYAKFLAASEQPSAGEAAARDRLAEQMRREPELERENCRARERGRIAKGDGQRGRRFRMIDVHDEEEREIAELRRQATRQALETGLQMLTDPKTPATARASVVRAFLTADAAMPDDRPPDPSQMSSAELHELVHSMAQRERAYALEARLEAEDAVIVELAPERGVFD